jgi:hypothetical protein
MKTNNNDFVDSCFNTFLLAVEIVVLTVISAKAQDNFNFDVLNGLFNPNQSTEFFQAGRDSFEQQLEFFTHPQKYLDNDLLRIDPKLLEQINQPRKHLDFDLSKVQYW